MATFFILNTVSLGTTKYFAGSLINDATDNASGLRTAGAVLWPSNDAKVAAAAAIAQSKRLAGAGEEELAEFMLAAAQTDTQTGTTTLVAGTVTVSSGITVSSSSVVLLMLTAPGGTMGAHHKVTALTVGGPGTGAFTLTAVDASGALVNTDTSAFTYSIIG